MSPLQQQNRVLFLLRELVGPVDSHASLVQSCSLLDAQQPGNIDKISNYPVKSQRVASSSNHLDLNYSADGRVLFAIFYCGQIYSDFLSCLDFLSKGPPEKGKIALKWSEKKRQKMQLDVGNEPYL